jgi:hypothetical protein
MKTTNQYSTDKVLRLVSFITAGVAIIELALSQFYIKMTRLSAAEMTGLSLFAFVIFGLVTLFAVTRMKESKGGKLFAVIMNILTALMATWYLNFLFHDEIFFRNLYYALDRRSNVYELLPLARRIGASLPLAGIIIGTAVYYLSGLLILVAMIVPVHSKLKEEKILESKNFAD